MFLANSFSTIKHDNPLYFYSCYNNTSSPSTVARILFFKKIYLPIKLKSNKKLLFGFEKELSLIGFSARESTNIEGVTNYYHICYYANVGVFGFIQGLINSKSVFDEFVDVYVDSGGIDTNVIEKF